jgi:uncharacterized protein YgiM (DUF1202 family)
MYASPSWVRSLSDPQSIRQVKCTISRSNFDKPRSIPLYRIPNDWSPIDASLQSESGTSREVSQNPQATVINSRLRVRSAPSLDGEMLGLLEIGEEVRVLEKSDQELNIGELTDFWYRIDNGNGLTGWAYGAFLRMDGE